MTTGMDAIRTALRQGWYVSWDGKRTQTRMIEDVEFSRNTAGTIRAGDGDEAKHPHHARAGRSEAVRCRRVVTSWGYIGAGIPLISREGVEVVVCGEAREWELVEYVQDMISCGKNKALIVLGHVVSEQAGMKLCAEWLRPLVPEVPMEFIAASEPFWSPLSPA